MKRSVLRLDALATDGVERAEPGGPPIAFRIWKAVNVTDHGPTLFSERSATLLLEEQARRGNAYCFDVNHLALDKGAPLESQRAVGWFNIEVRGDELWAVNCEFDAFIRDGLTKEPPAWKYFSPAYEQDPETDEVVSLVNIAVTNTPATWRVTALASRGASTKKEASRMSKAKAAGMKWGDIKAALDGEDEDAKATAYAAIKAAFPDAEPDGDEGKKDDAADGDKKDAEDEPEKKDSKAAEDEPEKKDSEDEPEKKDTTSSTASIVATQDARIRALEASNARFQKQADDAERSRLLASREISADLAKTLAGKPVELVREICASLPAKKLKVVTTETVQATRGGNQQDARSSRLSPEESKTLKERMGLATRTDSIRWEGAARVFPVNPAPAAKESK